MYDKYLVAVKLFESLQLSTTISSRTELKEDIIAFEILNTLPNRQAILDKIIELVEPSDNKDKRYLKAKALSWSRVFRNKEAILALNDALKDNINEDDFEKTNHLVFYPLIKNKNLLELRIHKSSLYRDLSNKYLTEYMFDEALESAFIAYELTPFYADIVIQVVNCFVRKNQLEDAKLFYEEVMRSDYFNTDMINLDKYESNYIESYKKVLIGHYKDLLKQIESGYIYKPRPRKV